MEFLTDMLFGQSIAQSIFVFAAVIAIGTLLSKIRIGSISLGSTWVLFAGIAMSHFGMRVDADMLAFARDFGLTLFVFSIGLQIGPGFFSSLRQGGLRQMFLAVLVMVLGVVVTYLITIITDTPLQTMVGVMDGAAVNTPAMGATQQAYMDITGVEDSSIPMAFAIAYPFGVVAVIIAFIVLKPLLRINFVLRARITVLNGIFHIFHRVIVFFLSVAAYFLAHLVKSVSNFLIGFVSLNNVVNVLFYIFGGIVSIFISLTLVHINNIVIQSVSYVGIWRVFN
jgi:AspT/YidE/YbjL antiporter-like protein